MSKDKPLFGDPCNRCGLCCLLGPCGFARSVLGQQEGTCMALRSDGLGGYFCGAVTKMPTLAAREAAEIAVGKGVGCDMTDTAADARVRTERVPRMREAARAARRAASPEAEALLRRWRLAPP